MPSPPPEAMSAELRPVLDQVVASAGFDLEDVDVRPAGRRRLVRVIVDSDRGVGLDEIATLSKLLSAELECHDEVLRGPYTLEVTSPGVERPLVRPRHWRRARLRLVEMRLRESSKIGSGTVHGRVGDAGEESVQVLIDGKLHTVAYAEVERASVQVEFRAPPAEELRLLGAAESDNGPQEEQT